MSRFDCARISIETVRYHRVDNTTIYDIYDGEFENGKPHGIGKWTRPDGTAIYGGESKKGKPHGIGGGTTIDGGEFEVGEPKGVIVDPKVDEIAAAWILPLLAR